MFWFIFVGVVLAFGIISWIIYANDRVRDGWALTAAICTFVPIFIGFCLIGVRNDYNKFERSFEIQRAYIEEIAAADPDADMSLIYMADMIEANQQLANYQAAREVNGFFSLIPERVFDIDPIGVP